MKKIKPDVTSLSLGNALRHSLFNKITPIMLSSDLIRESGTRLMIQSHCLEMVSSVEDLIDQYGLDEQGGQDHKS